MAMCACPASTRRPGQGTARAAHLPFPDGEGAAPGTALTGTAGAVDGTGAGRARDADPASTPSSKRIARHRAELGWPCRPPARSREASTPRSTKATQADPANRPAEAHVSPLTSTDHRASGVSRRTSAMRSHAAPDNSDDGKVTTRRSATTVGTIEVNSG